MDFIKLIRGKINSFRIHFRQVFCNAPPLVYIRSSTQRSLVNHIYIFYNILAKKFLKGDWT